MTAVMSNSTPGLEPAPVARRVDCDLCGPSREETVIPGRWPLVQCCNCGLVYMNPRPGPDRLGEIYDDSYYTNKPARSPDPTSPREMICDSVLQCFWGYPGKLGTFRKALYKILLRPLRCRVMPVPFSLDTAILDVGCGNGERLAELQRRGYARLFGVEPSAAAARYARSASQALIYEGTLESNCLPEDRFDLVILNQVLEHVPSPLATLREVQRILRPGGQLYLTVPNYGSIESRLFGECWAALSVPHHLYHFTRSTLFRLLGRTGFEVRLCRTDSISAVTVASLHTWARKRGPGMRGLTKLPGWVSLPATLSCDLLGQGSILRVLARTPQE